MSKPPYRTWAVNLLADKELSETILKLVLSDIERTETGCWEWPDTFANGYGYFYFEKANRSTHALVYLCVFGEPGQTLQLDHLCRNRCCCNPAHLEPVTPKENIQRGETGKAERDKTHCKHGHEYTPENTIFTKQGFRRCVTCRDASNAKQYQKRVAARGVPSHCKNGHEYTAESSAVNARGITYCTICIAANAQLGGSLGGRPPKADALAD